MLRGLITLSPLDIQLLIETLKTVPNQELLLQKLQAAQTANQPLIPVEISEEDLETMNDLLPAPSLDNPQALVTRKVVTTALQKLRHIT